MRIIQQKNNGSGNGRNGSSLTLAKIEQAISLIKSGQATQEHIEKLDGSMSPESRMNEKDKQVRNRLFDLQLLIDSHLVSRDPFSQKRTDSWKHPKPRNMKGKYLRY